MVGGQAPKAIRSVECYDFEEDRWDQIAELPSRRCRAGEQHHLPCPAASAAGLCSGPEACFAPISPNICALQTLFLFLPACPVSSYPFWGQFLMCLGTSAKMQVFA